MSSSEEPLGCNVKLPPVKQLISKLTAEVPYLPTRGTESVSQLEQERIFTSLRSSLKEAKDDETGRLTGELHSTSDQTNLVATCRRQDIEALKDVPEILHRLWRCRSDYMTLATEVLATESRKLSWRAPYGRVGILDFFLRLIATKEDVDNDLLLHSLRLIGNSCADTGMLKVEMTSKFSAIGIPNNSGR
ncbi:hypothetical protein MAP00_000535 [Monascus purpureus]|nr:hypothetical protein MAP00_000535 [Monascus purpureus]